MSTNPNNAIGTNGAFGGRTSVNAFNDVMGALSRGVLSGWACVPNSGLTVSLGGDGTTRDVAIAEDNAGNKTSINNISNSPVNVTIEAAPGANSRIDSIVAYADNPPTGNASETDNPGACGLIVVEGTPASTPSPANDGAIRTAITADGASGTTAYYVVLAYITMASGTTDITANEIVSGGTATIGDNLVANSSIKDGAVTQDKIDLAGLSFGNYSYSEQNTGFTWADGSPIYKKTFGIGQLPNAGQSSADPSISNVGMVIKIEGIGIYPNGLAIPLPMPGNNYVELWWDASASRLICQTIVDRSAATGFVTMYYTKN